MSKMIFNGLEFVAGQEINNNGVFINTDNEIYSAFTFDGTEHSWTAISDCILLGVLIAIDGATAWYIKLNDIFINASYIDSRLSPLYIKKGQIIKYRAKSGSSMTAYGLQSGTISNVQHNYSTSEQLIGTWIDGKQLYEKTVSFTTGNANAYLNYVTDIENPEMMSIDFSASFYVTEDAMVNATPYFGTLETRDSNAFAVLCNKVDNKLRLDYRVGSSAYSKSALVTVRYTKITD